MKDAIFVKGLRLSGRVGVEAAEREKPQPLEVDLELQLDLSEASESDKLEDTIDYKALVDDVSEIVSSASYHLLEALAARIADAVLERAPVESVSVSIEKLALDLGADLDQVQVRIARVR